MAAPPLTTICPKSLFFFFFLVFLVFWRGWIPYSPAPVREALLPFPVYDIFSFFQVLVPSMHPPWGEMFLWWEACRTLWLFVRHIECGTQVESGSNWGRMGEPRKAHVMHIWSYMYIYIYIYTYICAHGPWSTGRAYLFAYALSPYWLIDWLIDWCVKLA